VAVEGETRDLHPIARDEIYKIAAEALRNAYRHAHASRVEVEIRYDRQNSDCGCATMAGESTRRCSQARKSRATTDCVACLNAPR
jgi:signal transduction histidine kinase